MTYVWEIREKGKTTSIVDLSNSTYSLGCSKSSGTLTCTPDLGKF